MNNTPKVRLSASKIKTLEQCSWIFFQRYSKGLPDKSNSGANRGTCVHLIFELLLKPRHKKHYDTLISSNFDFNKTPSIQRLVLKTAAKLNVADPENLEMIYEMIAVGLNYNFYCQASKPLETEVESEVELKLEGDKFNVIGYIDKLALYKDKKGKIKDAEVWDYKSSKAKFDKKEINSNLQNLIYSLWVYETYDVIPQTNFLFLRFPKAPLQPAPKCSEAQLSGLRVYLENVAEYIQDFDEEKARANLANDNKEKAWLCGKSSGQLNKAGLPAFSCTYREPFDYYALCDTEDKQIKSAFNKEDLKVDEEKGEYIIKKSYGGCCAHRKLR